MDTGTHVVMGIGLAGLATIDPVIANDSSLFHAVCIGTLVGSVAPDFDTLLKLRNNAVYIRNHRGITHSIPAVILWSILITASIYFFLPEIPLFHLWIWTFLAVSIHVFVDLFNAYGTQALRPFSSKWIAFGFINTFDPYIFFLHLAGIVAWVLGANPGFTFITIYVVIVLYYIKRYNDRKEIISKIKDHFPTTDFVATSPTIKQNEWRVAFQTKDRFYVGHVDNGHIQLFDEFERLPLPKSPLIDVAKTDKNISAFLSFSPIYRWEIYEKERYTEVRLIDLRYRSKGYYPFVAVVQIDDDLQILNSYTGWIFSERTLQRKLWFGDSPT